MALVLCKGSAAYAADDSSKHFEIKAKPLADALMEFGVQSGLTVVAPTTLTTGKRAAAVRGDLAPRDALGRLLKGSGLTFARAADGTIAIQAIPSTGPVQASAGESGLDKDLTEPASVGEIVVTAQRREQRLGDVPLSVQAQTGQQLTQAGVTGTAMLEQVSPALSFESQFSATSTSFSMRGAQSFAPAGGIQPSVGVVIDGVPVARQFEAVLDLADIDRVEVLSGPQGTLFGKNATAGVINIVSNRPKPILGASGELTGTTDQEFSAKAMLNTPLAQNISARFNFHADDLHPIVKNLGGKNQYGERAWGGNGKLLFDFTDRSSLLLSAQYYYFSGSTGVSFVLVPVAGAAGVIQRQLLGPALGRGVDVVNQNSIAFDVGTAQSYTAELNSRLTDNLSLVAVTGYRRFSDRYGFDLDQVPVGGNLGTGFAPNPLNYPIEFYNEPDSHDEHYRYWSQEVRVNYAASRVDVVAGAYYQNYDEHRHLRTTFRFDGAYVRKPPGQAFVNDFITLSEIRNKTAAVFGDATVQVAPTVKVFGGLRYTKENLSVDYNRTNWLIPDSGFDAIRGVDLLPPTGGLVFTDSRRSDSNVSGRLGVQWQPTPTLNYYASYNRGYKGAAANVGSSTRNAAAAVIAPEIAGAYEIGAKQRFFDGRLAVDIALYKQTIDNIQQSAIVPGSVAVALVNAGSLKTQGFELNATARPVDGLTLDGGLVYNDARYAGPFRFACGPSATPGVGACAANGTIALDATQSIGTPEWKIVTSALSERALSDTLKLTTRLGYSWRSSIQYQLYQDPLTREPAYGIVDASIGLGAPDDRWQATLFVKNLTDKFHYSALATAATIAQSYGNVPRDFERYAGIRLSYRY